MENFPKKIDGYELKNILGDGATGDVYLAEKNGQKFAFKIFKYKSTSKKLMEKEYEISNVISPLKSPYSKLSVERCPETIVCSLDKGDFLHNNKIYYYLVMEYIKGNSLFELVQLHHQLDTMTVIKFIYFICKGIDYLHSRDIAHRDIKLENIIFNQEQLKIIDLGFGCMVNILIEPEDLSCYEDKKIYGTPVYISPQYYWLNTGNYSFEEMREMILKNDIWALGILFAELCNYDNVENYYGLDMYKYLSGISKNKPKAPKPKYENISPTIQLIIEKCLILDHTQRPTAREIMDIIKRNPKFSSLFS